MPSELPRTQKNEMRKTERDADGEGVVVGVDLRERRGGGSGRGPTNGLVRET